MLTKGVVKHYSAEETMIVTHVGVDPIASEVVGVEV